MFHIPALAQLRTDVSELDAMDTHLAVNRPGDAMSSLERR
jgi:hypothetical protein